MLEQRKDSLQAVSKIIGKEVPIILINNLLDVLTTVLKASPEQKTDRGFAFLVGLLGVAGLDKKGRAEKITPARLMQMSEPVKLLYNLVLGLGELKTGVKKQVRDFSISRTSPTPLKLTLSRFITSSVSRRASEGRGSVRQRFEGRSRRVPQAVHARDHFECQRAPAGRTREKKR